VRTFADHIDNAAFPCLGAKASVKSGTCDVREYRELSTTAGAEPLARDLAAFIKNHRTPRSTYATLVAVEREVVVESEDEFEAFLWAVLRRLNELDRSSWDRRYASTPSNATFKFSFGGSAFYVVGLNPVASRLARRFARPALVFNPVWQFERLRECNQLERLIERIRANDSALQGSTNPNLAFEGIASDALQYSGKSVTLDWKCPYEEWTE
jgi:hypothetical protein